MNKIYLVIIIVFLAGKSYSQALSHTSKVDMYEWDTKKKNKGIEMYHKILFRTGLSEPIEHISLNLFKLKKTKRPEFIKISTSKEITKTCNVYMKLFKKGERLTNKLDYESDIKESIKIVFDNCDDEGCSITFKNGFIMLDESNKVDVLESFLDGNQVLFYVIYPDKTHKRVVLMLDAFKKKYKKLK